MGQGYLLSPKFRHKKCPDFSEHEINLCFLPTDLLGKFYSLSFILVVIRFLDAFCCYKIVHSYSRIDYDYIKILENRLSIFIIQHQIANTEYRFSKKNGLAYLTRKTTYHPSVLQVQNLYFYIFYQHIPL